MSQAAVGPGRRRGIFAKLNAVSLRKVHLDLTSRLPSLPRLSQYLVNCESILLRSHADVHSTKPSLDDQKDSGLVV